MPEQPRRIVTATLVLGVPGAGKTSLLATFASYLWETHKRVLLLYSWDGGAIPVSVQKLVKQGLIRFWRARTRSAEGLAIETLYLATKGYWPRQINVETGETTPAVELSPALTTLYTVSCPKTGEQLGQLPSRSGVGPTYCKACKTLHNAQEVVVVEQVHRSRGFEQVGGVAFDGLTSMTNAVLDHMDHARGQGQIGGEKSAFGGVVLSGSIKLGGTNRADIGFGQTRGQQFVANSLSIPHLVEGPVFTALSMEATDEGGLSILGPKLPGRAATDEAPAWFGNVMEMGRFTDDAGHEHFALYLRPFTDAQGRRHLLKTSSSPLSLGGVPDRLVDPMDKPWSQANLGLVYTLLDLDLTRALAADDTTDVPGLAGTPTSYGEAFSTTPTPAPVPTAAPPAPVPVAPAAGAVNPAAAPPPVVSRRRQAVAATATAVLDPPAPNRPPPPPGMKPPQRLPKE